MYSFAVGREHIHTYSEKDINALVDSREHFRQEMFKRFGRQCSWNLRELKFIFPAASWEVIARRTLKYHTCVITIVDNGKVYFRRGSGMRFPTRLMPEEIEAIEMNSQVLSDQCTVRVWSVVEDAERVFLMTEMVE